MLGPVGLLDPACPLDPLGLVGLPLRPSLCSPSSGSGNQDHGGWCLALALDPIPFRHGHPWRHVHHDQTQESGIEVEALCRHHNCHKGP